MVINQGAVNASQSVETMSRAPNPSRTSIGEADPRTHLSAALDGASADSFPASDPPSWIPVVRVGSPRHDAGGDAIEEATQMNIATPGPLKAEHDELHGELAAATKLEGPVGAAAREVARLLHPHFLKEEEFALPPLGLLSALAEGAPAGEMLAVTKMTNRLRRELPEMLAEHAAILRALETLAAAARAAGDEARLRFAEKLAAHAKIEEAVMYPAAILVGELVKERVEQAFD
jgi:hypothetical protein